MRPLWNWQYGCRMRKLLLFYSLVMDLSQFKINEIQKKLKLNNPLKKPHKKLNKTHSHMPIWNIKSRYEANRKCLCNNQIMLINKCSEMISTLRRSIAPFLHNFLEFFWILEFWVFLPEHRFVGVIILRTINGTLFFLLFKHKNKSLFIMEFRNFL